MTALSFPIIPPTDEREPTDAETNALMHAHNLDLMTRIADLERDLTSARVRSGTLLRGLQSALAAATVAGATTVDGKLTVVLATGAVWQQRTRVIDTPAEAGFAVEWCRLDPVPDTKAAIVDELDETPLYAGMAVVG